MKNDNLFSHRNPEPESRVLYIVGTPIGNLNDLSSRAINILKNVSMIACEDTRQTKKIMNKFDISNNLFSFNKHNSLKKIPELIKILKKGKSIAVVSDAGLPTICDTGEDFIKNARSNGIDIICIPGPCAALTALVSSGFHSSKFIFEGFLPKRNPDREKTIIEISQNSYTTVLYESPHRLKKLLKELKDYCGGEREIQVSKELTKVHEHHIGPNINSAIKFFDEIEIKGEFTIIIKGINKIKKEFDEITLKKELSELIKAGLSLNAASKYLAKKENLSKREIYNLY